MQRVCPVNLTIVRPEDNNANVEYFNLDSTAVSLHF